jgi:hypothetical protein
VTPIRPNVFPAPSATTSVAGADAARAAAQKAFFAAAMGKAAAPAAAQATAAPRAAFFAPAPAPIQRAEIRPDPSAEAPAKLLRPGSLLDIRV